MILVPVRPPEINSIHLRRDYDCCRHHDTVELPVIDELFIDTFPKRSHGNDDLVLVLDLLHTQNEAVPILPTFQIGLCFLLRGEQDRSQCCRLPKESRRLPFVQRSTIVCFPSPTWLRAFDVIM